ncbi:zf-HC2 domain-containing protein [Lysinibacillus sp. KU-BSD001]|uniref:zf-HC2 domain-containing protein n=1 Tax=Lysinibacillus sp. KU-BSD001 TaxID=3141328 RepID=UPI0036E2B2CD
MNCNIVKDLLPSYVDDLCSEETRIVVEEHVAHCEQCGRYLKMMEQPTNTIQLVSEEVIVAKAPFKQIIKNRRIQVFVAIALTFIMTVIGGFVIQEVGAVNQIFFPKERAFAKVMDDTEQWETLKFGELGDEDSFMFDSVFWDKELVNGISNESDILLRVKDKNGHILFGPVQVPAGKSVKLEGLKRNEPYFFEIQASRGRYFISVI